MRAPVRIAVIGTGAWGSKIIQTLRALPECEVRHEVTRNYLDILSKDDFDAVIVATPGSTHAAVALPFIEKQIPVFIEKPMATSEKDARKILLASRKNKTPVFVGHLHLYNPAFRALKVHLKKIGKIAHITGEGASFGPFREDMSVLWDWAPHDVSMMLDIVRTPPTSVQAWADTIVRTKNKPYDQSSVRLAFKNGIVGEIHSSLVSQKKRRTFSVVGTHGMLTLDDVEKKLRLLPKNGEPIEIPFLATPPLSAELQTFIESCKSNKYSDAGAREGFAVIAVLEAAEKSAARGGASVRVKSA